MEKFQRYSKKIKSMDQNGCLIPKKLSVWFDKFTFCHETMSHHQYFSRNEVYSTFKNSEINGNEIKMKKD